jgi:hypothetical protein
MPLASVGRIRTASVIVLAGGILGGGWFERYAADPTNVFSWDGFTVWVAASYFLMPVPVVLANTVRSQIVIAALSGVLVLGGLFLYWNAMFLHPDAQGALVFFFIPFYQCIAVVAIVCGVIYARIRARMAINHTFERDAKVPPR